MVGKSNNKKNLILRFRGLMEFQDETEANFILICVFSNIDLLIFLLLELNSKRGHKNGLGYSTH